MYFCFCIADNRLSVIKEMQLLLNCIRHIAMLMRVYWRKFTSQKRLLSVEFLSLVLYLGCMLFQVFFYCWYGNELQLKVIGIDEWLFAAKLDFRTISDPNSKEAYLCNWNRVYKIITSFVFLFSFQFFTRVLNSTIYPQHGLDYILNILEHM